MCSVLHSPFFVSCLEWLKVALDGIGFELTWNSPLFSSGRCRRVVCSKASPVAPYTYPSDRPSYLTAF